MTYGHSETEPAAREADEPIWIEVISWDWNLTLALSSDSVPLEYRFQGALDYVRTFELLGRILAPDIHGGKTVRIWLSPFGKDVRFGPEDMAEVGRLYMRPHPNNRADFAAMLIIPEDSLSVLATCLASVSKFLVIHTFDPDAEQASVDRFSLASILPEGLRPWTTDERP